MFTFLCERSFFFFLNPLGERREIKSVEKDGSFKVKIIKPPFSWVINPIHGFIIKRIKFSKKKSFSQDFSAPPWN